MDWHNKSDQEERNHQIVVNFDHPANAGILAFLARLNYNHEPVSSQTYQYWENLYPFHPDALYEFWFLCTKDLPVDCRWIIRTRPVLVQPESGIIFAFATPGRNGHVFGFRLPPTELEKALKILNL